jgi:glycosyltransferase involved in cell wall biosynthesis
MKTQLNILRVGNEIENRKTGVLFVSSYPPRACGIASYCMDLLTAIRNSFGETFTLSVCALENKLEERVYPPEVRYTVNVREDRAMMALASRVNRDPEIDAVYIQHEFGLFGGNYGDNLLLFMSLLQKPAWVAFHTVLPNPDPALLEVVYKIVEASAGIVVLTKTSADILVRNYGIPRDMITVIAHGTHLVPFPDREKTKQRLGLSGKFVLSTFGLINAGKSIETAIEAMPEIVRQFPNAIYLILGRTHPEIVRKDGEVYREFLEKRVRDLGLENHVQFVNKYLSREDLLETLQATDVYLFVSADPNQAVSGTFAYAMSCSCAIVSTPISHALEMLDEASGAIVDFKASDQVARSVIRLLSSPLERKHMNLNALHRIRPTAWENSAVAHVHLFARTLKLPQGIKYSIPKISFAHLRNMTTSRGILQFSEISRPDPGSGYTLDDNARALIVAMMHARLFNTKKNISLINTYLDFIESTQMPDGSFMNYVDDGGLFHIMNHHVNLEDCNGRVVWALGMFLANANDFHVTLRKRVKTILEKAMPILRRFTSPRAIAFAIKGLYHYNLDRNSLEVAAHIADLGHKLMGYFNDASEKEWPWFEENLTYANSVLPESMVYVSLTTGDPECKYVAKRTFDFLLTQVFEGETLRVISNKTWRHKVGPSHLYGEQPIDVAYTILALDLFYQVFGEQGYRKKMDHAFNWFLGKNHLGQIIYNPCTGGCYDGLEQDHVNLNQGAESTICYLMARLTMEKYILNRSMEKERGSVRSHTVQSRVR